MPHVALVHGGEPCSAEALALSLSAFLIGSGKYTYFACTDGWDVNSGWSPQQRPKEYDRPLGAPLGPASRAVGARGAISYSRHFTTGTFVTLELAAGAVTASRGHGCIFWSDGSITGGEKCKHHKKHNDVVPVVTGR